MRAAGTTAHSQVGDTWLFRLLTFLLIIAPLHLGSNRDWAVGLIALGVAVLLPLCWLALMRAGESPVNLLQPARLPLLLIAGFALLGLLQWLGGVDGRLFFSADPYRTLNYLLRTLTYLGLFVAVLLLVRSPERIRALTTVVVVSGVLQAFLAIYLLSIGAQYQFMFEAVSHGGAAIGTFINRNHLASYLYLCASLGTGLLIGSLSARRSGLELRQLALTTLRFVTSPRMALRLGLVVMVIALVMTRSRMGNFAFFASLIVLGLVVAATTPALRVKALLVVASMVVIDIAVIGQWVGLDQVVHRIDQTAIALADKREAETVEERMDAARYSLPMIAERPILGTGGGTYFTAFPPYKQRAMGLHRMYFDHAHNDYIEIATDTGLLGLALLGGVVLAALHRIRRLLLQRHLSHESKGMAYAALMAITCLLLHSAVDFNLQIPANAMLIIVILGLLWAAPDGEEAHGVVRRPGPASGGGLLTAARLAFDAGSGESLRPSDRRDVPVAPLRDPRRI